VEAIIMEGKEIRRKFIQFFQEKGHRFEPSASLVPYDDPSLLWINSGVATLKKYFDGRLIPENPRIVNCQKSIRTNDIENVGKTARHHTLFEMLGNFSIGDYFKEEAITWAWEFLTDPKWIGFDRDRLSVTIHPEDDEAFAIWHEKIGIPEERIIRLEGNFWDIGEGPSGPNSEIFYDRGESFGEPNDPEMYPGGENERYLEVWNLVFSQFNHNPDGTYTPLPKKNIDTGMGLERMASILQDVNTNFETDLLYPLIAETCRIAGVNYHEKREWDIALQVIADHIRAVTFAVGDGVLPGNEGRGYVIRRLLRRAVRYGKVLGMEEAFLYRLVPVVGDIMGDFYPEVVEKQAFIQRVIKNEEERFHETLNEGMQILEQVVEKAKAEGRQEISGGESFKLYDTYGFPLDLTEDFAAEHGLQVDREGFEQEMETQRNRARAARQEAESMQVQGGILSELDVPSRFVGYDKLAVETEVAAIIHDGQLIDRAGEGTICQIVLAETPFYAESGGQIADQGSIYNTSVQMRVKDVQKGPRGQHIHTVEIVRGAVTGGELVQAELDQAQRADIIKNHTATHLLHQALKDVLGTHVNQAGSLVAPERLRFDFSHFSALTDEEIARVQRIVNEKIWACLPVSIMHKGLQEAKAMGAMALFGEKYGEVVRVVRVGDYSLELCGGCHVSNTAEIGLFNIVSESGIGAGTRRIEAVTGRFAYQYLNDKAELLNKAAQMLKSPSDDLIVRLDQLQQTIREQERQIESMRSKLGVFESRSLLERVKYVNGIPVLAERVDTDSMEGLREMVDHLKNSISSGIIVLGTVNANKVQLVAAVTEDYQKKGFHAGKLVKSVAEICGGGGGGRSDMAQAGGKDPSKLGQALDTVSQMVASVNV
jgi:alanyl-tRNA synthetase